jgi:hypothetical protein
MSSVSLSSSADSNDSLSVVYIGANISTNIDHSIEKWLGYLFRSGLSDSNVWSFLEPLMNFDRQMNQTPFMFKNLLEGLRKSNASVDELNSILLELELIFKFLKVRYKNTICRLQVIST